MKYQKCLKCMIKIGIKWELNKMRPFGTKTQGNDFRYAVNFAMIAKFRYLSEKMCIEKISQGLRNFCYGCEIFAILAKFSQCITKILLASCFASASSSASNSSFLLDISSFWVHEITENSRIQHQYEAKLAD